MSGVHVRLGTADVSLDAKADTYDQRGVIARYDPRDLCDATCAALLAVNTPDSVRWAHALYEATASAPRPTTKET